jgi:dipeptidyl aminopeptidase/acylaminoacyl peptidase
MHMFRRSLLTGLAALALLMVNRPAQAQDAGEAISFSSDGSVLHGWLYRAASEPAPTVILLHGFPGGKADVLGFGGALSAAGWNALSFTFRGMYDSEGVYTLAHTVEDVSAALAYLRSRRELVEADQPIAVLGWSGGGWTALMSAARDDDIGCAISVAGANMAVWARQIVRDAEGRQFWEGMLEEYASGSPARGRGKESVMELLEHSSDYDLITHAGALAQKPLLIVAGWKDQEITLEETILPLVRALQAVGAPRLTPITLNDDHMFQATRSELHKEVTDWLNRVCMGS